MEFKEFSNKINLWDQKIVLKYNGLGGKPLTYFLKFISFFGRETFWLFLIAFYLFIWYDPFLLTHLSATFLTGLLLIVTIKQVVSRERPFKRFEYDKLEVFEKKPRSKSFPSWHSYNIAAYGLLFGLFFLKSPSITILMQIFAILVSFSRIQLGVHYPSDVIFGYFVGIMGFIFSIYIGAPVLHLIIAYFEGFALHTIEYREINSMLFESGWYLILCITIYIVIFLSSTYRMIIDGFKKRDTKS